jgi:sulfate transport system ATP-binding protein
MSIVLDQITKRYGRQMIVDRVSLEVTDGELFVLLGPSGSGKSTVLRIIAGLTQADSGRILLHSRDVTLLPPQQRGTGLVFQNYSIFRHMTVADNIEFGLKIRKVPAEERTQKRESLLDMVGLVGLGKRYASQLSGGQQQRVALARALSYQPDVLLLDEPFGALDVKIRSQLRRSLKQIQQQLKVTAILVTHDQEEAFELADRIGVLERGRLLEVGTGEVLYSRPKSLFVATFLGAGTILVGRAEDGQAHFGPLSVPIPSEVAHEDGVRVQLLFRPEQVLLSEQKPEEASTVIGKGTVAEKSFNGPLQRVRLRLPRLAATRQIAPTLPFGEQGLLVDALLPAEAPLPNQEFWISLRGWHILEQAESRLMVFDNGAGSTAPLAIARWLTERLKARTTVLAVARDPQKAESLHETLAKRRQETGLVNSDLRIRSGDPVEQIVAEQSETPYEMMILGSAVRRSPVSESRTDKLSTTTMKVIEDAHVPVMVVKGERSGLSRILICTAAGEPGKHDVRIGGRLARRLGSKVTLLYISRETKIGPLVRAHLERAVATLQAVDVIPEVKIRQSVNAAGGILAEAREGDYDVIVMGGHGPRSRSLFGYSDVTMQVVAGADRPVIVVPEEDV